MDPVQSLDNQGESLPELDDVSPRGRWLFSIEELSQITERGEVQQQIERVVMFEAAVESNKTFRRLSMQ